MTLTNTDSNQETALHPHLGYGLLHTSIRMRNPVVSSTEIHRHLHSTPQTKADKTQSKTKRRQKNTKPYLPWEPGNERGRRGRRGGACRKMGLSPASPEKPWSGGDGGAAGEDGEVGRGGRGNGRDKRSGRSCPAIVVHIIILAFLSDIRLHVSNLQEGVRSLGKTKFRALSLPASPKWNKYLYKLNKIGI